MIVKKELEELLICPITHSRLTWLTEEQLQELNERLSKGEMATKVPPPKPVQAALKSHDHDLYYYVLDDIFCLTHDRALIGNFKQELVLGGVKQEVKEFYDEIGWHEDKGVFRDAKDSEDLRAVSAEYLSRCHARIKRYLPGKGKFLLDAASGPIQYEDYLSYSENFTYRVCADISYKALVEAKRKLGDKGIYLLCDVCHLPIKSGQIDALVSLHTLYHVPATEQKKAFTELYRVLKQNGISVVVYSWGKHSALMWILLFPLKIAALLKNKLISGRANLYFHAYSYRWFLQEIKNKYGTQLFCWRSVNVQCLKIFCHRFLGGKLLLRFLFRLEEKFPYLFGKLGAYPLFVTIKK